ncbi:hypothetical protein FJ365_04745 [Candidatus Dependentiae bacterium]|nr:hypothetical protein [Candidatus Dependentiae bacterium]
MLKNIWFLLTICLFAEGALCAHRAHRSLAVREGCDELSEGEMLFSRGVLPLCKRIHSSSIPMVGVCCLEEDEVTSAEADAAFSRGKEAVSAIEALLMSLQNLIAQDDPELAIILQQELTNMARPATKKERDSQLKRECMLPAMPKEAVENDTVDALSDMVSMRKAIKLRSNIIHTFSQLKTLLANKSKIAGVLDVVTSFMQQLEASKTINNQLFKQIIEGYLPLDFRK